MDIKEILSSSNVILDEYIDLVTLFGDIDEVSGGKRGDTNVTVDPPDIFFREGARSLAAGDIRHVVNYHMLLRKSGKHRSVSICREGQTYFLFDHQKQLMNI